MEKNIYLNYTDLIRSDKSLKRTDFTVLEERFGLKYYHSTVWADKKKRCTSLKNIKECKERVVKDIENNHHEDTNNDILLKVLIKCEIIFENNQDAAISESSIIDLNIEEEINAELKTDSETIKYRVREDNILDILMYSSENKPYILIYLLSKNKNSIILNNGVASIKNSFTVGPNKKMTERNVFSGDIKVSSETIDETNYTKINLTSNNVTINVCSYSFDNEYFRNNFDWFEENYNKVISQITKIFNDVAGNFDYKEVRATKEEEKILDDLIAQITSKETKKV